MTQIGDPGIAETIAYYHHGLTDWLPDGCDQIGQGSQRTVYADYAGEVVYKVGDDGANRREVRTLTDLRERGVAHAPAATVHAVTITDPYDGDRDVTVVTMPYLPDDGSVPGPYPLLEGAADLNPHGNVHAHGGQLWLIDAGGL
ncbi:hypothetical protein [Salinispora arenicola]|uniref:hypothetical protein n=1 Tax=Salinispora arenicola TaxID=168697 RepID=UPI0003662E85|nr:hypothetical protein [Salinispora arenicola]